MSNPVDNRSFCEKLFSCCSSTEVKPLTRANVTREQFNIAIGNKHKKAASTDVISDRQFMEWMKRESEVNAYLKERQKKQNNGT